MVSETTIAYLTSQKPPLVRSVGLAASLGGAASRAAAAAGTAVNAAAVNNGFSSDDFPALGAGAVGVGPAPHQFANGSSAQAVAVAAAAAAAAEQASAAAALQHQASQREAHRIGMLSSVNGSPHAADRGLHPNQGLNAARAGFGELDRVSRLTFSQRPSPCLTLLTIQISCHLELCDQAWYHAAIWYACTFNEHSGSSVVVTHR